jgi:molybdopterin-containing oxidoreductase family membrane subunit
VIDQVIVMTHLFINYYSDIPDSVAFINLLFFGDYSKSFWLGQVGIGALLPLSLLITYRFTTNQNIRYVWLASISCLIGIWFLRMNFIAPTLSVPLIEGLSERIYQSSTPFKYEPSFMEWMYSFFIISSGVIMYLFGIHRIDSIRKSIWQIKDKDDNHEEIDQCI